MTPALETAASAHMYHEPLPEPAQQISREVAHELNNILTIIQGYAERMILKHGENPALRPELQMIFQNAKRATSVVRQASPRKTATATRMA